MIKAVAFDMDGVLVDTERLAVDSWVDAGKELKIPGFSRDMVLNIVGLSRTYAIEKMLSQLNGDKEIVDKLVKRRDELYFGKLDINVPKKYYAAECLADLKEAGFHLLLVTSTSREYAMIRVERTSLYPFFDDAVFGDMVTRRKPDPMIYQIAQQTCGYACNEIIAIEDSPVGIQAAKGAGLSCIMVPDLIPYSDRLPCQPDYICKDLSEVAKLLINSAH